MGDDDRLREVEIDLASHLRECAVKSQMVWDELRSQRRILTAATWGIMATLATVCGVLLKSVLHL